MDNNTTDTGITDDLVETQICGTDGNGCEGESIVATRDGDEGGIPFHRHCQKTVCSAYGYSGNGATWTTLSSPDLTNLNYIASGGDPSTWIGYFTNNTENITQDLRSILELIDRFAAVVWNRSFTLKVNGPQGNISSATITPFSTTTTEFNINNIGRYVVLNLNILDEDGQNANKVSDSKFYTTASGASQFTGNLNIPSTKLYVRMENGYEGGSVQYKEIGNANVVSHDSSQVIDIPVDNVSTPLKWSSSADMYVFPWHHVIKYNVSSGSSIVPVIHPYSSYNIGQTSNQILTWEWHVKDMMGGQQVLVDFDNLRITGLDSGNFTKVALTDQNYIEPGKTNAYVFRFDCTTMVLTWSLAYVY